MDAVTDYYLFKLKDVLSKRQQKNPHYSLRAYARHLRINPGTLSKVLNGERKLSSKSAETVMTALNLGTQEKALFMESLEDKKLLIDNIKIKNSKSSYIVSETNYKIIAEWEHFVVLDLFDLNSFDPTTENIQKKLGLSKLRAEVVLENLIKSGLIDIDHDGKFIRRYQNLKTTDDIPNQALVDSHIETLEIAQKKIEDVLVEYRDFSSISLPMDLKKLPEAKAIIKEFRQKMKSLLEDDQNKTEIYQLAVQLYPLTSREEFRSKAPTETL